MARRRVFHGKSAIKRFLTSSSAVGVSTLIAGNNITLDPANGEGSVTITAAGGGGTDITGTGADTYVPYFTAAQNITGSADFVRTTTGIGIGTDSPASQLNIAQTADDTALQIDGYDDKSGVNAKLHITSTGIAQLLGSANLQMKSVEGMYLSCAETMYLDVGAGATYSHIWRDDTNGETMRLKNGQLGIGTASPDAKLHVVGRMVLNDSENNVAIGTDTIGNFTSATRSVVIGDNAGSSLSSGDYNVLLGAYAGAALSTQGSNTIIGTFAGQNTTTTQAVYVGYNAGYYNSGDKNVFIGKSAGQSDSVTNDGEQNVAIGLESLKSLHDGHFNVAIGSESLKSTTSGSSNVALGEAALHNNKDGYYNVAVGRKALYTAIPALSAGKNTAVGYNAGYSITTGTGSVFIGYYAGQDATATDSNKLFIANAAGTPLIGGDFSTGKVEMGTDTQDTQLQVNGKIWSYSSAGTGITMASSTKTDGWELRSNGTRFQITEAEVADRFMILAGGNVTVGTDAPLESNDSKVTVVDAGNPQMTLGYDGSNYTTFTQGAADLTISNTGSGDDMIFNPNDKLQFHAKGLNLADTGGNPYLYIQMPTLNDPTDGAQILNTIAGQSIRIDAKEDVILKSDGSEIATFKNGGNVGIGITGPTQKLHVAGDFNLGSSVTLIENPTISTISGTSFQYGTSEATYAYDALNSLLYAALILTDANYYVVAPRPGVNVGTPTTISTILPDGSAEPGIKVTISQLTTADPQAPLSVTAQGSDVIYEGGSNSASAAVAIDSYRGANKTFLTIAAGVWIVID